MIEAYIIDEVTEELSASEKALEHTLDLMNQQQPVILGYLFSESFEAFEVKEREYLLFLSSVIWKSVFRVWGSQNEVSEVQIQNTEERNWAMLKLAQGANFQERLNTFFEEHKENEELLSFIEDALVDDDESPVTAEGREPLFVSLKTVADCLLAPHL